MDLDNALVNINTKKLLEVNVQPAAGTINNVL